jgi:glycosyltransferase involved in cell wall biosynthesis
MEERVNRRIRIAHVATVDMTHRFLLLGQLCRLRDEGFDVTAISAPGGYADELEAQGIRHIAWPHATRAWDPKADVRALFELVAILRRGRFHLVHTHTPKPGVIGRVAARMAGVPVVLNTVHGYYATREDPLARRVPVLALEWIAARFSDLELYQSREDLAWARTMRLVRAGQSWYLGNGTDLSVFDPSVVSEARLNLLRQHLGIPADVLVVGTVGRMVEEKGYREFFTAAREVRRRRPDVRFLAVGQIDVDKGDAISPAEIANASMDVVFTGWRTDIADLLALMDVFVLASWREGVPRSAIEAATMRKPLILTNVRGCREVVREGVEGFLVPPRNPLRLAEAISRLLDDPGLRERMGAAARAGAVERFDEARVAERVVSHYRRLLRMNGVRDTSALSAQRAGTAR